MPTPAETATLSPFPTRPDTPEVTSPTPEGVEGVAAGDVHMECTPFFDADGDGPRASEWEVWDAVDDRRVWFGTGQGLELTHVHLGNGRFEGPLAGQRTLEFDRAYRLRVRYRDDSGDPATEWSEWSPWRSFRTAAFGIQPLSTRGVLGLDWVEPDGAAVLPQDVVLGVLQAPTESSPGFEPLLVLDTSVTPPELWTAPPTDEPGAVQVGIRNHGDEVTVVPRSRLRLELPDTSDDPEAAIALTVFLPRVQLDPGQLDTFWVARNGASFFARTTEAAPDFSRPARETPWPWVVPEGFVTEEVQRGLTFPTQIVFHPQSERPPGAPRYYIMELQGRIWAVGDDGGRWVHAENLIDFSTPAPSGNAGQVGLGGMTVDPETEDLYVTRTVRAPAPPITWTPTEEPAGWEVLLPNTAAWSSGTRETKVVRYVDLPPEKTSWSFSMRVRYPLIAGRERWIAGTSFGIVAYADADNAVFATFESNRHRLETLVNNAVTMDANVTVAGGLAGWLRLDYDAGVLRAYYRRNESDPWQLFHENPNLPFVPTRVGLNARNFFTLAGRASFSDIRFDDEPIDPAALLDDTSTVELTWLHNQIIRLRSEDGGRTAAAVDIVLDMPDDVSHPSHQIQDIDLAPDGTLIASIGDGFDPYTAQDMSSFLGKLVRLHRDGTAPVDNPFFDPEDPTAPRSYVYALGLRNTFGMVFRNSDGRLFCSENGPSRDRVYSPEPGWNMGYDGTDASMLTNAIFTWAPAIAPVGIEVLQTNTFPEAWRDWIFLASAGQDYTLGASKTGKRIHRMQVDSTGSLVAGPEEFLRYEGSARATVIGLAFGPDGLYFTTLYDTDPISSPFTDARVIRVRWVGHAAP